jgi:hypothetical protein
MKKPDFFVIGAPKCGTTSVASWLSEHPKIYMSPYKEPHHFNTDQNWVWTPERSNYEAYFDAANSEHCAVGEASSWYLYSQLAVAGIERYQPAARYIVCLRNPVEMAYSLHEQMVVSGREHVESFATAWDMSDERKKGLSVTRWCREPRHLAYGDVCKLGEQLQRLYRHVPRERVHTVLMDDIKIDTRAVYLDILSFLRVPDTGRAEFFVLNSAKQRRSMGLRRLVQVIGNFKRGLGIRSSFGVLTAVDRKNIRSLARTPLSARMRCTLQAYFADDIALLEMLTRRGLRHWLES